MNEFVFAPSYRDLSNYILLILTIQENKVVESPHFRHKILAFLKNDFIVGLPVTTVLASHK